MKKQSLFFILAGITLLGCSSSQENKDSTVSSSFIQSQSHSSSSIAETSSSEPEESSLEDLSQSEEESSSTDFTWNSKEEAIVFYENTLIEDEGEEMANMTLNMEFYDRESWELIKKSGDTILLSNRNGGIGGENIVEFVKGKENTNITFFTANSPYPDRPTTRWIVQNSDMVIIKRERLNPIDASFIPPREPDDLTFSDYSSEEVEYARVWLEVIKTMGIEELNVSYKSKGEPVNPNEKENSATYPENVIVLRGRKIAEGMVTYSGNGNGTINLYEVPSYWQDGIIPKGKTMKEYTTEIIKNPILVPIGTDSDEFVTELIEKENIQK